VEGFSVGDQVFAMADDWESFAIVDGFLVTGQNPASSTSAARALPNVLTQNVTDTTAKAMAPHSR
jgi:putative intracellular protease/amidase